MENEFGLPPSEANFCPTGAALKCSRTHLPCRDSVTGTGCPERLINVLTLLLEVAGISRAVRAKYCLCLLPFRLVLPKQKPWTSPLTLCRTTRFSQSNQRVSLRTSLLYQSAITENLHSRHMNLLFSGVDILFVIEP